MRWRSTRVRRSSASVARSLASETPTLVSRGSRVTFQKGAAWLLCGAGQWCTSAFRTTPKATSTATTATTCTKTTNRPRLRGRFVVFVHVVAVVAVLVAFGVVLKAEVHHCPAPHRSHAAPFWKVTLLPRLTRVGVSLAKDRATDADDRRTLVDRHLIVLAHPHRQLLEREARADIADSGKVGPGVVVLRRHRHEPGDAEAQLMELVHQSGHRRR